MSRRGRGGRKERRGGEGRRGKEKDGIPETLLKVSTLAREKH